ncbi:hypothetical protein EJ110_NYTH44728 [Nymphaea thermarum]|nr:hypothetical protein EJ110_NYTH44728 [Nymphaea thermarum]
MRAGAGAVQQTLGAEAAIVIKQAVALAKRRGHAQVTPLHVAATLLSSRSSLLRRACLKSHPHPTPHPLQCRALELCFNVALNRSAHNLWQARWANSLSLHSVKQNPPFLINESPLINSPIHAPNWKHCAAEREQLRLVIDVLLLRRKKNIVLLGDSIASTEGLVSELKCKIEAGVVPQELRSVKFFTLDFSALSIRIMKREDVDSRLTDLRRVVQSFCTCGVIIYVGNMKWVVDEYLEKDPVSRDYNPAEHLIMEIGRFLSDFAHYTKLWLLGIANTQTFMRCQTGQPSIESQWALQAVPIPSGGLSLTLHSAR